MALLREHVIARATGSPSSAGVSPSTPPTAAPRAGPPVPLASIVPAVLSGSLVALFVLPLVALFTFVPFDSLLSASAQPGVRTAFAFTLLASGIALGISLGLGVPLGYVLARWRFRGKPVLESVVTLPIMVPHLVAGLALLILFAPDAPLGALAVRLGVPIFDTIWGTVLVMVYVSASYVVLASEIAFRSVDERLREVARTLGASPSDEFATVALPVAARGIVAGALLAWARSVSEIGGFLVLAFTVYPTGPYTGPVTSPLAVYVYNLYQISGLPGAAAVASLFVLLAFGIFLAVRIGERVGLVPWAPKDLAR